MPGSSRREIDNLGAVGLAPNEEHVVRVYPVHLHLSTLGQLRLFQNPQPPLSDGPSTPSLPPNSERTICSLHTADTPDARSTMVSTRHHPKEFPEPSTPSSSTPSKTSSPTKASSSPAKPAAAATPTTPAPSSPSPSPPTRHPSS